MSRMTNVELLDVSDEDFFRTWTTDALGRRVMRGPTFEQSAWYQEYQAKRSQQRDDPNRFPWKSINEMSDERDRWLALREKHEAARISTIVAEAELREDKPKTN